MIIKTLNKQLNTYKLEDNIETVEYLGENAQYVVPAETGPCAVLSVKFKNDEERYDRLIPTTEIVYIMNDNGKTIDVIDITYAQALPVE